MTQQAIGVDAVLKKVASDVVVQGENLRAQVRDLTLQGLRAREHSLGAIKEVLKSVAEGVNAGAAKARIDVEKPLADALAGMDDALLKVVHASQLALERILDHGADFKDSRIREAVDELDGIEEEFLGIVRQCAEMASQQVKTQWAGVFAHMPAHGTGVGVRAGGVAARLAEQMRTTLREQRLGSAKVSHELARNYGMLASGILIGMSEGLEADGVRATTTEASRVRKTPGTAKAKSRKAART